MSTTDRPILILGANGKTGRRVALRLHERGIAVRAGSRSGDPPFDWARPETWTPALDGVERALGLPPWDVSEFARRTAATGVWDV